MAKLFFRYGAMNCGKTTALLQTAYNYQERGMTAIIIKPAIDTKGHDGVLSRIGLSRQVNHLITENQNITDIIQRNYPNSIDCILVDEAQFLTPQQIEQLFTLVVEHNIPVICYGLRVDFRTKSFPGSQRLFELAHSIEELKTICQCGKKAIFNGRQVNGQFTNKGQQVAIDEQSDVTYESLCGHCYLEKVGHWQ